MNDLCVEIGYNSINHVGEELCGDHVEVVGQGEDSSVLVLADGLGSGVKANILSILTSRIISTMIAEGLPLEECVKAIAATLPICSVRKVPSFALSIMRWRRSSATIIPRSSLSGTVHPPICQAGI